VHSYEGSVGSLRKKSREGREGGGSSEKYDRVPALRDSLIPEYSQSTIVSKKKGEFVTGVVLGEELDAALHTPFLNEAIHERVVQLTIKSTGEGIRI